MRRASVVLAVMAVAAPVLPACSQSHDSMLFTEPVASIYFAEPTDVWIAPSGTLVLQPSGGGHELARYGPEGLVEAHPVDELDVLDEHRLREVGGTSPVVIDSNEYALVDGTWVKGDCYSCRVPEPDPPVLLDRDDGSWRLTVAGERLTVDQPDGWDGTPAEVLASSDGDVVIAARLGDNRTEITEVTTDGTAECVVEGRWQLLSATADSLVLAKLDDSGRDHSTARAPRCWA